MVRIRNLSTTLGSFSVPKPPPHYRRFFRGGWWLGGWPPVAGWLIGGWSYKPPTTSHQPQLPTVLVASDLVVELLVAGER